MDSLKVIKNPVISEKSLVAAGSGEYTFEVDKRASKGEITRALKAMFDVDALTVKTRVIKNKSRRVLKNRKRAPITPIKKATVTLKKDQKLDVFEVAQK